MRFKIRKIVLSRNKVFAITNGVTSLIGFKTRKIAKAFTRRLYRKN